MDDISSEDEVQQPRYGAAKQSPSGSQQISERDYRQCSKKCDCSALRHLEKFDLIEDDRKRYQQRCGRKFTGVIPSAVILIHKKPP